MTVVGDTEISTRSKILLEAADILEERWCPRFYDDGKLCIVSAVAVASGEFTEEYINTIATCGLTDQEEAGIYDDGESVYDFANSVLGHDKHSDIRTPFDFNDGSENKNRVVNALRYMAETGMSWDDFIIHYVEPMEQTE